jgi:dTDP-4-dehydrorhamnose 3,5-epimerase
VQLIEGVLVKPCKKLVNERGFLQEVLRADEGVLPELGQTYFTQTRIGIVKAWYRHHRQVDTQFVVTGTMRMALYDDRQASPTTGQINEWVISASDPFLIRVPPGVWHGFKAEDADLLLLHINSGAYDFNHTDEDRLPPDSDLIPYKF